MRFIKTLTRCWNCWSSQWGINKYLPSRDGAHEVFETTGPEGLAKPYHSLPNAPVVALSHSYHEESLGCYPPVEYLLNLQVLSYCRKTTLALAPTSLIWPDYGLTLPQPRLTDFLSRKPGNKETEWKTSGFHPTPKSWAWGMRLHLWNAGKWSWVSELLLLCVACYNIYWKHGILKVVVQEKADFLLSLSHCMNLSQSEKYR